MKRIRWVVWGCWLGAAAMTGCGSSDRSRAEGETHWLAACDDDDDCGAYSCLCGLCTETCTGSRVCDGEQPARCFSTASPGLARACGAPAPNGTSAICLPDCDDQGGCGSGLACLGGACIVAGDAGMDAPASDMVRPDPRDQERASIDPREYADMIADIDLAAAPVRPPRRLVLRERHPELLGSWREDCSSEIPPYATCSTLEISATEDGSGIVAWLQLDAYDGEPPPDHNGGVEPHGPFEPPTDPDVAYPEGMTRDEQSTAIWSLLPGVRYPLLSLGYKEGALVGWTSPLELWHDWCALQSSHPIYSPGLSYECLADDVEPEDVDPLLWQLCRSDPRGRASVCHCSEDGCRAASHNIPFSYRVRLEDSKTAIVESQTNKKTTPFVTRYTREQP